MDGNITLILQKKLLQKFQFENEKKLSKNFFFREVERMLRESDITEDKIDVLFNYFKKNMLDLKGNYDISFDEKRKALIQFIEPGRFQSWGTYMRYCPPNPNKDIINMMMNIFDINIKNVKINTLQEPQIFDEIEQNDQFIRVLGERNEAYNNKVYHKILKSAKKRIDIISITGEKVYVELIDILKDKLINESITIRFLTIDPNSEFMKIRLSKLGAHSSSDYNKFTNILKFQLPNTLYKLKEENEKKFFKNDSTFEHRYFDDMPYFGYIRVDNQIIFEPYTSHQKSKKAIVLLLDEESPEFYEYLNEHFNSLWYSAKHKFRIDNSTLPENIYEEIIGINSSFATYTIERRFPKIISNLYNQDNNLNYKHKLDVLKDIKRIELLEENHEDIVMFNKYIDKYKNESIFDVPFLLTEYYFYWKILEFSNYFESKIDPFYIQKEQSAQKAANSLVNLASFILDKNNKNEDIWDNIFLNLLWSNREGDLSQISMLSSSTNSDKDNVLINDSKKTYNFIKDNCYQIDFVLDNSGYELAATLVLAFYLLENEFVKDVNFHVKKHPIFVSDTTKVDVDYMMMMFAKHYDKNLNYISEKLTSFLGKSFKIHVDDFWTEPILFSSDDRIKNKLYRSHLVIIMGDLNYRRLIGDRHWPFVMDIRLLSKYFPTNFLIIRTLKSEVLVNIPMDKIKEISQKNKNWLVDGSYGLIQLVEK
ncbi:MAG: DUF89 family protein [Bacteroidales bacterium]|nr:DUF89 family protein [Bacteroidales bacterium]